MKVEIELDPAYLEPTFVIRAAELTPELSELIRSLQSTPSTSFLIGYLRRADLPDPTWRNNSHLHGSEKKFLLKRNEIPIW